VDAAVNFSVGRYVADAVNVLREIEGARLPIFVGGTGLYFKALTEGLSDMPPVPEEVREQVRRDSEGLETPELHRLLLERDPETAQTLRPTACESSGLSRSLPRPAALSCPFMAPANRGHSRIAPSSRSSSPRTGTSYASGSTGASRT
jgi:tRNA dimethylallyltransferase